MTKPAFALAALLAAGAAAGQSSPRPTDKAAERQETKAPALNLRLEDAPRAAPRITFGTPESATKEADKNLPELGGKPSASYDRPINPNSSGSPIPKPFDPSGSQAQ